MDFVAVQNEEEINAFAALMKTQVVRSYLEIGSKFGGALWRVVSGLPTGVRVVSVDLPRGTVLWHQSEPSLRSCCSALEALGHHTKIIWGDSTDQAVIDRVRDLGPFDVCFIDANHTLPYLEKDWANYGSISKIVAFHDISWRRDWPPEVERPIAVPEVWERLKADHQHVEIKLDPKGKDNGIGVLWRS